MNTKFLKSLTVLAMSLLLLGAPAMAQETIQSVETLIAQFTSAEKAPARNPLELRTAYDRVVDHFIPLLAAEDFESRYAPQMQIAQIAENAGRRGAEKERFALGMVISNKLTKETPLPARTWLVRQLEVMGGSECVRALSACLVAPEAELREAARRALEQNPATAADDALLAAFRDNTDPVARIGLMNSLGVRGKGAAVPLLAAELGSHDPLVANVAARALSNIANAAAVEALFAARSSKEDARQDVIALSLLDAAVNAQHKGSPLLSRDIYRRLYADSPDADDRAAALAGLATVAPGQYEIALEAFDSGNPVLRAAALQFARNGGNRMLVKELAEKLPNASEALQLQLLGLLADMGGEDTATPVLTALQSRSEAVRLAAIDAAAILDGEATALALLDAAGQGAAEEEAALDILARLQGQHVQAALLNAAKSGTGNVRLAAVKSIAVRGGEGAIECLTECAATSDNRIATAALRGIGDLGTVDQLELLAQALATTRDNDTRVAAQRALVTVARRADAEDAASKHVAAGIKDADAASQQMGLLTLRILGADAGLEAINVLRSAENGSLADNATRQLCEWPAYAATKELLTLAAKEATPLDVHVLALRGVTRLLGTDDAPAAQRLKDAREALGVARRGEEKRQLLAAVSNMGTPESAGVILPYFDDDDMARDASEAAVALAKRLERSSPDAAQRIARQVIDRAADTQSTEEAKKILGQ